MAVTIVDSTNQTYVSVSPIIPAAGTFTLPASSALNLIVLVWSGTLSDTTITALQADGYQITVLDDGSGAPPASGAAVKWADGTETTVNLLWVDGGEQQVGSVTLAGATLAGRDTTSATGTASAVTVGSVNLGIDVGVVLVWDVVTKASPVGALTDPLGYTELFHTVPDASYLNYSTVGLWYLNLVTGVQLPGVQDDVAPGSWTAGTLSFLALDSNLTETVSIRVQGVDVSVPGETASEPLPVPDVSQFAREPYPAPPDPTSIELPTPPWIPDGQYRRNDVD